VVQERRSYNNVSTLINNLENNLKNNLHNDLKIGIIVLEIEKREKNFSLKKRYFTSFLKFLM